jgi:two-component sensor histidine kinase
LQKNESRVSIEGPEVLLEPSSAQAIAVTLHELATNAAKYGALSATEGQIEVKWSHTADGRLTLLWTETGGPPVKAPTRCNQGPVSARRSAMLDKTNIDRVALTSNL